MVSKFVWRRDQASIKKHVQKLKDIYYQMWRHMAELGMAEQDALDEVRHFLCAMLPNSYLLYMAKERWIVALCVPCCKWEPVQQYMFLSI